MPEPQLNSVHVNRPLTNISQAYMQDASDYIADKIFPVVPVQHWEVPIRHGTTACVR